MNLPSSPFTPLLPSPPLLLPATHPRTVSLTTLPPSVWSHFRHSSPLFPPPITLVSSHHPFPSLITPCSPVFQPPITTSTSNHHGLHLLSLLSPPISLDSTYHPSNPHITPFSMDPFPSRLSQRFIPDSTSYDPCFTPISASYSPVFTSHDQFPLPIPVYTSFPRFPSYRPFHISFPVSHSNHPCFHLDRRFIYFISSTIQPCSQL